MRGIVDALGQGRLKALEVTMTVPRAIELIAEIAPTLPSDFLFGRRPPSSMPTPHIAPLVPVRSSLVSPVLRPEVIKAGSRRRHPRVPGCFNADGNSAAWDRAPTS